MLALQDFNSGASGASILLGVTYHRSNKSALYPGGLHYNNTVTTAGPMTMVD
jgi:hypothetical protein